MKEALKLALEALENYKSFIDDAHIIEGQYHWLDGSSEAITVIKEALAQPDYRVVKTYHEGKPVYVSQPAPPPPECKTVAEQTAYAFGWWKALESVRTEQPTQEPVAQWQKRHHLWTEGAWENSEEHDAKQWRDKAQGWEIRALYTTPQQRPWVELTDIEIMKIINSNISTGLWYMAIEIVAKFKEKNFD